MQRRLDNVGNSEPANTLRQRRRDWYFVTIRLLNTLSRTKSRRSIGCLGALMEVESATMAAKKILLALKNWSDALHAGVPKLYRRANDGRLSSGRTARSRVVLRQAEQHPLWNAEQQDAYVGQIHAGDKNLDGVPFDRFGNVQNLSHIWSGDGFGLRDLRLIERPHVHVALG
jgi:hypothetical protein